MFKKLLTSVQIQGRIESRYGGPISLTTSPDNMPRTGCSYQYTTPYCRFLFWAIFKTRKPPRLRGPALSICYQKVVPKVRVELTRGHPHRFLSLVRAILVSRLIVLTNVWIRQFCHQVPSGQYLIPIDSTALHGAN